MSYIFYNHPPTYPQCLNMISEKKTHSLNSSSHSSLDFRRLGNVETLLSSDLIVEIVGIASGIVVSACSALTICVVIIQQNI